VQRVVRSYFDQRDSMEAVSRVELQKRIRTGSVTHARAARSDDAAEWRRDDLMIGRNHGWAGTVR
jgi:hypothetical protein